MTERHIFRIVAAISIFASIINLFPVSQAHAAIPTGDFSLEVSPSPLFATVEPGKPSVLDLRIRNASLKPEELKIETRAFTTSKDSQTIDLSTTTPETLAKWVTYANPVFSIDAQSWFTEKITLSMPEEAGFSYPFAVVISRAKETATDPTSGRLLRGSIAVFMLINVDKPGATRQLAIESLKTSEAAYEYLPATIQLTLKNTGNSIVQPYGNFYVQRGENDSTPLALMPVNASHGYILPGATKEFTASWDDGFPSYKKDSNGSSYTDWESKRINKFRFGKYTVKAVAAYNDGARDVPLTASTTFWVLPWKIGIALFIIFAILGIGCWTILRSIGRRFQAIRIHAHKA